MLKSNHSIKTIVLACVIMMVLLFGCGSNIESPPLRHAPTVDEPHAPNQTIVRLRECVEEYGGDLGGAGFSFHYEAKLDADLRVASVKSDVFHADFDACTRAAIRAMEMPEERLLTWMAKSLAQGDRQTNEGARGLAGNVVVIVGVVVTLAPIVIKAAGVTIVFVLAVAIGEEVIEAIRRRRPSKEDCIDAYEQCMDSNLGDEDGNNWNMSRCATCLRRCQNENNIWPLQVPMPEGWVPCGRLGPNWRN